MKEIYKFKKCKIKTGKGCGALLVSLSPYQNILIPWRCDMSAESVIKNIDFDVEQYHQWLKEREKAVEKEQSSRFVTISREYGCDGYPVAGQLCDLLNERTPESPWHIFTHPILEKIISDEKLGLEMVDRITETRYSFAKWFFDGIVPDFIKSPQLQVFQRLKNLILNLSAKGNCILVGGGAQVLTHRFHSTIFQGTHIRLIGSHEFRVKNVMKKFGLNRGDAENQIEKKQFAREKFIKDFTDHSSYDNAFYHLVINNEWLTPKTIAKLVFQLMEMNGIFAQRDRMLSRPVG